MAIQITRHEAPDRRQKTPDATRALEKTFADYFNVPFSGKNDRWRSLGVLEVEFKLGLET